MGKKTTEEKLSLMEFLYKDTELISSLYSQLFGGDLESVSRLAATSEECNIDAGVNLYVAKANSLTKDIATEELVKNIISKDDKVIELFSELNLKECTKALNNYKSGKIIKLEGNLYFRNLDTLKNVLPLLNKLGYIPSIFTEDDTPEIKDLFVDFISKSLPHGLEFEVVTNSSEKAICCVNENYLINDINHISKNYTNKYIGKWTIIGILDNISPITNNYKYNSSEEFRKGLDEVEESVLSIIYPKESSKYVIKPIIIYRNLNY